jgi:formamidopyrimidine-DNA glycosylase
MHLRMSGDVLFDRRNDLDDLRTHDRLVLVLDDGWRMALNDPRKFGRVWLVDDPQSILGELGPEPLDKDFTVAHLGEMLAGTSRQLKPLLMDQHFLAGMGNIYTDEALHRAKLHPLRLGSGLNREEVQRLFESIQEVLREGIERNGVSIDWVYRGGNFQNTLRVYGRTGETCAECQTPIERITVGQRGTHFCPRCQPMKNG